LWFEIHEHPLCVPWKPHHAWLAKAFRFGSGLHMGEHARKPRCMLLTAIYNRAGDEVQAFAIPIPLRMIRNLETQGLPSKEACVDRQPCVTFPYPCARALPSKCTAPKLTFIVCMLRCCAVGVEMERMQTSSKLEIGDNV